jgi:8-oxo-dGTP pyrophosphatase MutT (NUDIX family)
MILFMNSPLIWKEESRRTVYSCPIFSVGERICRSPADKLKPYTVIDTLDWAIVIPVLETERGREFVMVKQWRHGAYELSLEFPGGVCEKNEEITQGALRELREETGYSAGKITKLGEFNPNPAIMSNQVHFFLAEELNYTGTQQLDEDEYVNVETVAWEDVVRGMGKRPYIHALMGTALALYLGKLSFLVSHV